MQHWVVWSFITVSVMEVSLMKPVLDNGGSGKVVRIDIGSRLDMTAYEKFREATVCAAESREIVSILVDLSETHRVFDSGMAMLLDLKTKAGYLGIPLRLVNVRPEIRRKLAMVKLSTIHLNRYASVGLCAHNSRPVT
jgi:anti-anti-sigma regulatory factor